MPNPLEVTNLYYKGGGSDKVYVVEINPSGSLYTVDAANGRRGGTLVKHTKTNQPVAYAEAEKIYQKLVKAKMSKGYTAGGAINSYVPTALPPALEAGGIQLLNAIDDATLEKCLKDPSFLAQPKIDGRRIQIRRAGGTSAAVNRKGTATAVANGVLAAVASLAETITLDGEMIGETYYVFDLLQLGDQNLRTQGAVERYDALTKLAKKWPKSGSLVLVPCAKTTSAKRAMFKQLKAENAEGIVFKQIDAPYTAGRPHSGGDQLKYKFYATCTVRVAKVNQKRSVALEVLNKKVWTNIGNVTVPADLPIPPAKTLIEVRYLYAHQGGSLFQPVLLCERDDLEESAACISQLKYKAEVPVDTDDEE